MLHLISSLLVFWLTIATCFCLLSSAGTFSSTSNPNSRVKIGALVAFNSTIGKVALHTLQLAVQNVNKAEDLLKGTQLELEIIDTGCNPLQGAVSALELMKKEVVAIVGPQSSLVSHFVAHIGEATQVPILSFGATDPSLSEKQYSYFLRLAPSDAMQMEAVAALIASFDWIEVALIYTDDDYGVNGASALSFSLQKRGGRIVERAALYPDIDVTGIREELTRLENSQSRVFVLHTQQELGFKILNEAFYLNMIEIGYVWIVTDLVANELIRPNLDPVVVQSLQGLLGTRRYISPSPQLQSLLTQWQENYPADMQSFSSSHLNAYALYAYDAVCTFAHAISQHLAQGQNLNFTEALKFPANSGRASADFEHIKILQGGSVLKKNVLGTMFSGTSGLIQFDEAGDIKDAAFEYINMVGKSPLVVAYWANQTSLSTARPQLLSNFTTATNSTDGNSTKLAIVWPGGTTDAPRGWVLPKNGEPLKIGVPKKAGYAEIVSQTIDIDNVTKYDGFCIKVFEAAVGHLRYAVPFQYYTISSNITGQINPEYDDLIKMMVSKELDAAVGDITITAERLKLVDFTQPYIESGLVVLVARKNKLGNNRWAFLRPFTTAMWGTIFGFTLFIGFVIWILEHRDNAEFGQGPIRERVIVVLSFTFATLFSAHREDAKSVLGRVVLLLWLFVVLILNSSYTASLTAILTVEQLAPDIQGLDSLLRTNLPIGYQTGSFVRQYLIDLNVNPERLKVLGSLDEYKRALDMGPNGGGVAAIVDELPYVEIFLASNCDNYGIAGQEFTKSGWGFALPLGSELSADLSEEILKMSRTGELAQLHDYWFKEEKCEETGTNVEVQSNQLDIKRFWVLFVIMGGVSMVCVVIYLGCNAVKSWEPIKKFIELGRRRRD